MTNLTSVLNQLEQERIQRISTRTPQQRTHSVERNRQEANRENYFRRRSRPDCCRTTRKMGEGQGTEGRFNHFPKTQDVTSRPSKDCGCAESTLDEVAEGTEEGLDVPRKCRTRATVVQQLVAF